MYHHPPRSLSSLSCSPSSSRISYHTWYASGGRTAYSWLRWRGTERRLLSGVDKEKPSAEMEVKPDEVKLCLIVVTWFLLRELSAPKVTLLHTPSNICKMKVLLVFEQDNTKITNKMIDENIVTRFNMYKYVLYNKKCKKNNILIIINIGTSCSNIRQKLFMAYVLVFTKVMNI